MPKLPALFDPLPLLSSMPDVVRLPPLFCANVLFCRPPGVCSRSLTFQLALQLQTVAFSPDVQSAPRPAPPRRHASACAHESHTEDENKSESSPAISMADYGEGSTGIAVTHDGGRSSQGRAGCGLGVTRGRARTFDNKPFVPRPDLEDFSLGNAANDAHGNAWWEPFERAPPGGREERRINGCGKDALGRVEASPNAGHGRGGSMSTSPSPHERLGVDAGSRQLVPPIAVDMPARKFGNGDMVMVATLLAHPESLLKVSGGSACSWIALLL